ncbi:MAG: formylglycine-generating enzyme family protein [Gammaproteobacteria bacterium]|nr:formylglycine-generating enzyme family protein [Gammaproteobacteria bacterium]
MKIQLLKLTVLIQLIAMIWAATATAYLPKDLDFEPVGERESKATSTSSQGGTTGGGKRFTNSLGMQYVYIPPGKFTMGSPSSEKGRDSDERQHKVTLTEAYYMQTTEVTIGQWRRFVTDTGYRSEAESEGWSWIWNGEKWENKKGYYWAKTGFSQKDTQPVICMSWNDAQRYVEWLNTKEGTNRYRLPTEAEWEYAARAGSTTAFTNGGITELGCSLDPKLDAMGWYCGNSNKTTHPVAQKKPNAWGLYDMHGNVWEWVQDWEGDYPKGSVTNPTGPTSGSVRVLRGGSWDGSAGNCRSANRFRSRPGLRSSYLGFRLVLSPGQ